MTAELSLLRSPEFNTTVVLKLELWLLCIARGTNSGARMGQQVTGRYPEEKGLPLSDLYLLVLVEIFF